MRKLPQWMPPTYVPERHRSSQRKSSRPCTHNGPHDANAASFASDVCCHCANVISVFVAERWISASPLALVSAGEQNKAPPKKFSLLCVSFSRSLIHVASQAGQLLHRLDLVQTREGSEYRTNTNNDCTVWIYSLLYLNTMFFTNGLCNERYLEYVLYYFVLLTSGFLFISSSNYCYYVFEPYES